MSISLLHRLSNAMLVLICLGFLLISMGAYSDNTSLSDNVYLLDEEEINERALNALWLERGMDETQNVYESHEALQKLAQDVLKKYWGSLSANNKNYDRFTPIVNGHYSSRANDTDYNFRITGDTIKLSVAYSF